MIVTEGAQILSVQSGNKLIREKEDDVYDIVP